jgi:hypothetical protein
MATTGSVDIDSGANQIIIRELRIQDGNLVKYLQELDNEKQNEAIIRALRVGAETLGIAETSKDLEYVRREFESMQTELGSELDDVQDDLEAKFGDEGRVSRILDSHFGDDGSLRRQFEEAFGEEGIFSDRLDEELGQDGERIQAALDPDRDGSPTQRLEQRIKAEIKDLRDKLVEEETEKGVKRRTTLKGGDFEDVLEDILGNLVHQTSHTFENTAQKEGELTGRDVGDFVITLGDTGQRIVVEAKSDQSYTEPKIKEEMADAIENRSADFGIFVSECESYLPRKIGYLQEYDRQFVVVSVSQDEDDDIDRRLFRIGYNWAKMRAAQAVVDTGSEVDPEVVQSKVEGISDNIEQFRSAKKKCTNIKNSANGIEADLDSIADDVNSQLNDIRAELSKASG